MEGLDSIVDAGVEAMRGSHAFRRLSERIFTVENYQGLIRAVFHQTYNAPLTFALAGANCSARHAKIRDYLLNHAVEEKDHWQWAKSDLNSTGVDVGGLEDEAAPAAVAAFVAFNFYLAHKVPFARMGTAYFLETMSARLGPYAAKEIANQAGLSPKQMVFFFGHAEADQGHAEDLKAVILASQLNEAEFGQLAWAAKISADLYLDIYQEAISA